MATTTGKKPAPAQRLASAVRARREELDMTQQDMAERGGPSIATIRAVESGRAGTLAPRTVTALERALGWNAGSIDAVLTGGEPTYATASPGENELTDQLAEIRRRMAETQNLVEDFARRATGSQVVAMRLDPGVWREAQRVAAVERRTVNDVIKDAIQLYSDVMGGDAG